MCPKISISLLLCLFLGCSEEAANPRAIEDTGTVSTEETPSSHNHMSMEHSGADMSNMVDERKEKDTRALSSLVDIELRARFALEAASGLTVTESDYQGQYLLIGFGFTQCRHVCPTLLSNWAQAYKLLPGDKRKNLQTIFISLDPQRDTPSMADTYSKKFDPGFVGLAGTPEQVASTAKNFRITYVSVPLDEGDYKIDHTSITYLVSPEREVIELFGFGTGPAEIAEKIVAAIR
jgi:protein SCO1/2